MRRVGNYAADASLQKLPAFEAIIRRRCYSVHVPPCTTTTSPARRSRPRSKCRQKVFLWRRQREAPVHVGRKQFLIFRRCLVAGSFAPTVDDDLALRYQRRRGTTEAASQQGDGRGLPAPAYQNVPNHGAGVFPSRGDAALSSGALLRRQNHACRGAGCNSTAADARSVFPQDLDGSDTAAFSFRFRSGRLP